MSGSWSRWRRGAAWGVLCLASAGSAWSEPYPAAREFSSVRSSTETRRLVEWILREGDHRGRPFAVVDKAQARLYVFDGRGGLLGHTAALLGSTWGDHIEPGVGLRAQTGEVRLDERTTPAGRFEAQPGRNDKGEHVVWVDYESAFAIHRLRPGKAEKARAQRLASMSPDDNRVSYGCVIVPVAFYQGVVEPVLGTVRSVVYVLPETRPAHEVFNAL
jgi:hypothetical protein